MNTKLSLPHNTKKEKRRQWFRAPSHLIPFNRGEQGKVSKSANLFARYRDLLARVKPNYESDSKSNCRRFVGHIPLNKCEHEWKDNTAGWFDSKEKTTLKCAKCLRLREDVNESDRLLQQVCKEADLLRQTLRTTFGDRPIVFKQAVDWSADSKASGAQYPVHRIRPSDGNEFSVLAGLFDEYKCEKAETHFVTNLTNTSVAVTNGSMAYDPVNSGAYSTIIEPLIAAHKFGPFSVVGAAPMPLAVTRTGFHSFTVEIPKGPQYEYGVSTSIGTGAWTDTGVTAVDYGYFKFAIETGGTGTTYLKAYDIHHVAFRCRS